ATSRDMANAFHTATLLPSGRVLVVGGNGSNVSTPRLVTETYDPLTGSWTQGAPVFLASDFHTATLLPTGKVLVVAADFPLTEGTRAWLYDPATDTWGATGVPQVPRYRHTATLLPTGKVLVVGGYTSSGHTASAEVYDPATGTWTATGSLSRTRVDHLATLLPTGKVLVTGGSDGSPEGRVEVYDPASGTWSLAPTLAQNRSLHTATLLPTGGVLVTGGLRDGGSLAAPEVHDETGVNPAWRPGLVSPANALRAGSAFSLDGSRLMGVSGEGAPVVTLLDLARETLVTLPSRDFTSTRLTATMPLVPSGQYVLFATAEGLTSGTVVRVVRDEAPLETTLGERPPVLTRETTATFSFTSNAEVTFECRLDGASFASCTAPVVITSLVDGAHTFQVRARDAVGTVDPTPATHTWTVDTQPPETRLTSGPPGTSRQTTATFVFDSEAGATFECRLDGGVFVVCASPATYANISVGSHTFQVRATDAAGHVDATPASHVWSIDLSPPAAPVITSPASGATLSDGRLTVTGTAPPRSTVFIVLDGVELGATTANEAGSWSFTPARSLTEGQHTVSASARVEGVSSATSTPVSFSVDLGEDTPPASSGGCGCGAGPGDGGWMLAGLLLLAGVASRRQRRRFS
ncbi:kelch repeat-containing protein, partial [Pyxidicoccus sp. 3LG]